MATSDSDADFESADEELRGGFSRRNIRTVYRPSPSTVDSESDDDIEYVQHIPYEQSDWQKRTFVIPDVPMNRKTSISDKQDDKINSDVKVESDVHVVKPVDCAEKTSNSQDSSSNVESEKLLLSTPTISLKDENMETMIESNKIMKSNDDVSRVTATKNLRSKQRESSRELGKKKLGTRITKDSVNESPVIDNIIAEQMDECSAPSLHKELLESGNEDMECRLQEKSKQKLTDNQSKSSLTTDLSEIDMPEELKSDKKFKEVFQPEGWEELGCDIELPDELTEEKLQSVMEQLSLKNEEPDNSSSWSNWSRNVTSLINTATASVSTLTNHVSQGLTLLEGTIGIQDTIEVMSEDEKIDGTKHLISYFECYKIKNEFRVC